jgi:hypothetical protein
MTIAYNWVVTQTTKSPTELSPQPTGLAQQLMAAVATTTQPPSIRLAHGLMALLPCLTLM